MKFSKIDEMIGFLHHSCPFHSLAHLFMCVDSFNAYTSIYPFEKPNQNAKQLHKAWDFDGNVIISDFLSTSTPHAVKVFSTFFFQTKPDKSEMLFISLVGCFFFLLGAPPNKW